MITAIVTVISIIALVIEHYLSNTVINSQKEVMKEMLNDYRKQITISEELAELNEETLLNVEALYEMVGVDADIDDLKKRTQQISNAAIANGKQPGTIGPKFIELMKFKYDHGNLSEAEWQSVLATEKSADQI